MLKNGSQFTYTGKATRLPNCLRVLIAKVTLQTNNQIGHVLKKENPKQPNKYMNSRIYQLTRPKYSNNLFCKLAEISDMIYGMHQFF